MLASIGSSRDTPRFRPLKEECINHCIPMGQAGLRHFVTEYLEHYHRERPHAGLDGAVKALLDDLVERGLDRGEDRQRFLFVVDGAKALTKAIRVHFGDRAEIQRCQIHMERNILGHLPDNLQFEAKRRLRAAWGLNDYHKAKAELERVGTWLEQHSHGAAASLAEGLEETITIHRLAMPPPLRRCFRTTNPIVSPFAHNRDHSANGRKGKDMQMRLRWAGMLLLDAKKRFRKVQHAEHMPAPLHTLGRLDSVSKTA